MNWSALRVPCWHAVAESGCKDTGKRAGDSEKGNFKDGDRAGEQAWATTHPIFVEAPKPGCCHQPGKTPRPPLAEWYLDTSCFDFKNRAPATEMWKHKSAGG